MGMWVTWGISVLDLWGAQSIDTSLVIFFVDSYLLSCLSIFFRLLLLSSDFLSINFRTTSLLSFSSLRTIYSSFRILCLHGSFSVDLERGFDAGTSSV